MNQREKILRVKTRIWESDNEIKKYAFENMKLWSKQSKCPFGFHWSCFCISQAAFSFFFFFFLVFTHFGVMRLLFMHCSLNSNHKCWLFRSEQCIHVLFMDPQIPLFSIFFIKNESHGTIHIFKNVFATVFSVFSFSKISSIQTDPKMHHIYKKMRLPPDS